MAMLSQAKLLVSLLLIPFIPIMIDFLFASFFRMLNLLRLNLIMVSTQGVSIIFVILVILALRNRVVLLYYITDSFLLIIVWEFDITSFVRF